MKRVLFGVLGVGTAVAVALLLLPVKQSSATIVGTAHDLSGAGYGTDQVCIFCHTPHNAMTVTGAPLWNHEITGSSFTLYSSATLDATPGQPDGASKLCLSCHDGTVAIDSYGENSGTTYMTGDALLDTDLSNDHPISFTYNAALASTDGELVTPESAAWVDAGHVVPLFDSKMQCASCHDVHDNTYDPFLVKANSSSALCLTCHLK